MDLLNGGYKLADGSTALSAEQKMFRGRRAMTSFAAFRQANKQGNMALAAVAEKNLQNDMPYFGYGRIQQRAELVPPVNLVFWSFRVMIGLGMLFVLLFLVLTYLQMKRKLNDYPIILYIGVWCIPLVYICSEAGWICAEVGRQPWAIQDLLPVNAAVSSLQTSSVQLTFFIFLAVFTLLLIAEIRIMCRAIQKGPEMSGETKI